MENEIVPDPSQFDKLKEKVVVLTGMYIDPNVPSEVCNKTAGGASGIGAATVRLLHAANAFVVFGDLATSAAEELIFSLGKPSNITFVATDVTSHAANLALFKTAFQRYGRVDHAISIAGISEQGNWFDPTFTIFDVEKEPNTLTLDVNLKGMLYFARISMPYLREGKNGQDRSLTVFSSVAGFRSSPGLAIYQCSKHGVVGLLRALKSVDCSNDVIRVNCICPGMTDTNMAKGVVPLFRANDAAVNAPEDVARLVLAIGSTKGITGKAILAIGARAWDFEDGLDRTTSQWLGETPARLLEESSDVLRRTGVWNSRRDT